LISPEAAMMFRKIVAIVESSDMDSLMADPVVQRAELIANAFGARVKFVRLCHESGVQGVLTSEKRLRVAGMEMAREARRELEALVAHFADKGIKAECDALFLQTALKPVVGLIEADPPDLIVKSSQDASFRLGLLSTADWDLIREFPVPVWFTREDNPPIEQVVAAIDQMGNASRVPTDSLDRGVVAAAVAISKGLGADIRFLHALNDDNPSRAMTLLSSLLKDGRAQSDGELVGQHAEVIESFARYVGVTSDKVIVSKGSPAAALQSYAKSSQTGLIVMGVKDKSRWERFWRGAFAEETLDGTPCDILFIKPEDLSVRPDEHTTG
jgi:universal stress protein E